MRRKIELDTYPRRKLFEVFKDHAVPYFSITSSVDITSLKEFIDQHRYGFFMSLSFFIAKAVNLIPALRQRIIQGELIEFSRVDPSFTVLLDDDTFSFCHCPYVEHFADYREQYTARIKQVKACPDQSQGAKQYLFFMTNIPWVSFTSMVHPYDKKYGSIPNIAVGKYFAQGEKLMVPIGIQVHHGVVDGIHVGKFYQHLSEMCQHPAEWLQ